MSRTRERDGVTRRIADGAREPRRLLDTAPDGLPAGAVLSSDEAQRVVERVVAMSDAESVQVTIGSGYQTNVRFAANQMSTAGAASDVNIAVESAFGAKHAITTTNDTSDEALRRAVKQSEALARLAPDDPEAMEFLGAQTYQPIDAWFASVADLTAGDRAKAALTALRPARAAGDLAAAGFVVTNASSSALGNSKGLFAYHRQTNANYTLTVRTSDGTGSAWVGADHPDWRRVDFAALGERAIARARLSRDPVAIEPGRYTVILEPQAVGDLVQLIAFQADARSADEGRSPFSKPGGGNKIGEKIVDERVSIYADPADPMVLAQPWDNDGLPLGRQEFVKDGTLRELYYSRFWAKKQGKQATGAPTSIIMKGGSATVDELVASTERGVLVTRLWYLRQVDPRTILYTGLTRDGTFLVENGKLARSIKNFRFNESPLFMLNNLDLVGRAERLAGTEAGGAVVMPALKVRDFNFTSLSDAV
jgi:predicted Zn-dependent protease